MSDFDFIDGKVLLSGDYVANPLWDALPQIPKVQSFYQRYEKAEGWIGDVYFVMWNEAEIADYWEQDKTLQSRQFLFFGGTGASEGFGVHWLYGKETYFSAQFVSDIDKDRSDLGDWAAFRDAILKDSFI